MAAAFGSIAPVSLSPVSKLENSDVSHSYADCCGPKASSPIQSFIGQVTEMDSTDFPVSAASIRSLFDNCDRDGRGFITSEDFQLYCGVSPELAEQVLSQLDVDEDGMISFDEFFHGFQSIAKHLQDGEEEPVSVSKCHSMRRGDRPKYLRDESVFELNPLVDDDRWMEVVIRLGLPESIANSLCMKRFWTKLHSDAPALLPSLEAVLSDVSVQLRCADESLRTLNNHLHRKEAQHVEEVASFQEEVEEQLSEIIQEYAMKGSSARRKLEGHFVEAVNEKDDEIKDLLLQIHFLKEELEHRKDVMSQNPPAEHTASGGTPLTEQLHIVSTNPTSEPTTIPKDTNISHGDSSTRSILSLGEHKEAVNCADEDDSPVQFLLPPVVTERSHCVVRAAAPSRMFKVVFLGDSGVGKTLLIRKMCNDDLSVVEPTIGVDFMTTIVETCKETVAVQLWDTAGQERFAPLSSVYLRRADAVALVYDVTSLESFRNISKWFDIVKTVQNKGRVVIAIVGAKSDLKQAVSAHFADQAAARLQAPHFHVSSYSGENVADVLMSLTRLLLEQEDECIDETKLQLQCERRGSDSKCSC